MLIVKVRNGDFSDPPGLVLYTQQANSDSRGFTLFNTFRGSNINEQYHDRLRQMTAGRNLGAILIDASLAFGRVKLNTTVRNACAISR